MKRVLTVTQKVRKHYRTAQNYLKKMSLIKDENLFISDKFES